MKKILITGKNSYIGESVEKWLLKEMNKYKVDTIDMKGASWKEKDFSNYDVIFHVAGIAHIKETHLNSDLYYEVNRDLAYETAKKAKKEGVHQFVFLSSMSVYGVENGIIHKNTPALPKSTYGKSKIEAEKLISNLQDDTFTVTILRPPIVYGYGCKGNYPRLVKIALRTPIFPRVKNKRSMIHINNLSEFIKIVIDNNSQGVYFPQNTEYVNTSELVRLINEIYGNRKIIMTELFNPIIKLLNLPLFNKVFGDLVYDMDMSSYHYDYRVLCFEDSIRETERHP
jgi:nucleoside-diphosphate-sugar epimerase